MTDPKKYEKAFGLDIPFDEAVARFANVTKAEIEAEGLPATELIPEGHEEHVPFKGHDIRKVFHNGEWFFSIIDVIGVLTNSSSPARYWTDMKRRMADKEGFSQAYAGCVQLKMEAPDGRMRETEAAHTEGLFRIIQSIPSPLAEPFKRWLARVGYERIQEIQN